MTKRELKADPSRLSIVETVARWRDRSGDLVVGVVVGGNRVRMESATWSARYRDGDGIVQTVSIGCRDKTVAAAMLSELETTADRVKRGVFTSSNLSTALASKSSINGHVEAYVEHLKHSHGKGKRQRVSAKHLVNVKRSIERIVADCGFKTLQEIKRDEVQRWVSRCLQDATADWSNRTINSHVEGLKAFCAWCIDSKPRRLTSNPLSRFPMLDTENSLKRPRRALNANELGRLLTVARLRPVAEYGRETVRNDGNNQPSENRSRATWTKAPLTLATIEDAFNLGRFALRKSPNKLLELEQLGKERELLYLVLVTTGLRKGELTSINVGQAHLEVSPAWIELSYRDEKAGRGASVPLRDDVADKLRNYLDERLQSLKCELEASDLLPIAGRLERLPFDLPLIPVPKQLVRILDRDLAAAGVPKVDERGESVDVHAMRHTFSTMLHRAGVSPSVAQAAMRHSDIRLTMKTYNHLGLMDVSGAIESLPVISGKPTQLEAIRATGTDLVESFVAPLVAPVAVKPGATESITGKDDALQAVFEKPDSDEKTPVFLDKTGVFDSRSDRIRTYDPLVPNQMR